MGYLPNQEAYYTDEANWGSYAYVSLFDICNNFLLVKTGNANLVNNTPRYIVQFHAKSTIQTLNYDAVKETKRLELNIEDDLRFILPSDYVAWVKISLFKDGALRPMTENIQATTATQYSQNAAGTILFDVNGAAVIVDPSDIDGDRLNGTLKSLYLNNDNPNDPYNGEWGWYGDWGWYFPTARFGLETSTANINPTFTIGNGVINFSSEMNGQSAILEYVTDGMANGDDTQVFVNKLFEKYMYKQIEVEILSSKLGVQEYIINRLRKLATAELRNARIRISNIHPSRLLMAMRGQDKALK